MGSAFDHLAKADLPMPEKGLVLFSKALLRHWNNIDASSAVQLLRGVYPCGNAFVVGQHAAFYANLGVQWRL